MLYKNVKFSLHPTPKKTHLEIQNPHAPCQPNPILKEPLIPPPKKPFLGKKEKKRKCNPLSKNSFGKGKRVNTSTLLFLFS
jgi:hypothetical protein